MQYTKLQFKDKPPQFSFRTAVVYIGVDPAWPDVVSPAFPVGAHPGWTAVDWMRRNLQNERLRTIGLKESDDPTDILDVGLGIAVLDLPNRVGALQRLSSSTSGCDETLGSDLVELGHKVTNIAQHVTTDPTSGDELKRLVRGFGSKHRPLTTFTSGGKSPAELLERVRPLVELGTSLGQETSLRAITRTIQDRLLVIEQELKQDAASLRSEMLDRAETLAALSAHVRSAGDGLGQSYVILTRDINELLGEHRETLASTISRIESIPFSDIVLCNPVWGDTSSLHAFAEELRKSNRASIWASIGDIRNEDQGLRYAQANPKQGMFGSATLCLYAGRARHRGYQVPVSAMIAGNRLGRDQAGAEAMLDRTWGPQPSKNLSSSDETFDTLGWADKAYERLAVDAGINVVRRHASGVRSPAYGRTPCTLEGYQQLETNRTGAVILGNALSFIDQALPAGINTPEAQRAFCQDAGERFFKPFKGISGFHGEFRAVPSSTPGTARASLTLRMPDFTDNIVVTYNQI